MLTRIFLSSCLDGSQIGDEFISLMALPNMLIRPIKIREATRADQTNYLIDVGINSITVMLNCFFVIRYWDGNKDTY